MDPCQSALREQYSAKFKLRLARFMLNDAVLVRRIKRRLKRAIFASANLPRTLVQPFLPRRTMPPKELPPAIRQLQDIPDILDYTGEFGAELVLFLPWCNWLSANGLLRTRRIRTYRGMRSFYDDLDCLEVLEKDETRYYVPLRRRNLPVRDEHDFDKVGRSPFHLYPDLRRKFLVLPVPRALENPERPVLVVHNKYNSEWDGAPVNYIPLDTLEAIFTRLKGRFKIVYVRHGMRGRLAEFSDDEMQQLPFDDRALLDRHPTVLCFDDLYDAHRAEGGGQDVNTFKNALYSRTHRFITTQGGGAHHIALFSGSLLVVLHRRGRETELAYGDGYYSFMANPAPLRVICLNETDLLESLALFDEDAVVDDRILVPAVTAPLLRRLSPVRGQGA